MSRPAAGKYLVLWLITTALYILLYLILRDMNISPVIFHLGPLQIRWYGLMYVVAIFLGLYFLNRDFRKFGIGIDWNEFENAAFWVIIFALLGARLYHVIPNWDYYGRHPSEILAVWHGGLGIYGGVIGGLLAGYIIARIKGWDFWLLANLVMPYLALGQAIGRWGNFFNKELYGPPSDLPWAIYIPPSNRLPGFQDFETFHPTFLYEGVLDLANFFILYYMKEAGWFRKRGALVAVYLINYGIIRFFVEFFRPDSDSVMGIKLAHIVSVLAIVFGVVWLIRIVRREAEA